MKHARGISLLMILASIAWRGIVHAQVGPFAQVRKLPTEHCYLLDEDGKSRPRPTRGREAAYWIAFSDSENNLTYSDPYGRKRFGKLGFLQPLYVLRTRNGYCKVAAYDPKVLAGKEGLGGPLGARVKRYRIADPKKVRYLGWIKESYLLHSTMATVDPGTLLPLKYLAAINHPKMVVHRELFVAQDSILMNHAPGFRKLPKSKALLGDWMYVYKKQGKPAQYLVGTEPMIDPDSIHGTFGWVTDSMVLPLAQNLLLLPAPPRPEAMEPTYNVHWTDQQAFDPGRGDQQIDLTQHLFPHENRWLLPVRFPIGVRLDSTRRDLRTFVPSELIDLQGSKVYNCIGQPFTYPEYQALQKQLATVNLVVVFEDGKEGKESLRSMISSFQELSGHMQSTAFAGYRFNYAAVGYMGRWVSDTLNWTSSFSQWLNFIQNKADDASVDLETYEHVMLRGIQEAAVLLKEKPREHNVVIVIGSKINAETFPKLFDIVVRQLAETSANLLFIQPNLGKAQNYSDFVLQAKRMLDEVGKAARRSRQSIIVNNQLVKNQNTLKTIDRCGNGYLYDFPGKSMQKGGLFFPNANQSLCPDLLEWVMDTLLRQIRQDHDTLLSSMRERFSTLGYLQQDVNPRLQAALEAQGIIGLPDELTNTYADKFFVEVNAVYDPRHTDFTPGFLVREDAFAELGQAMRSVVIDPKVNRNGDSEVDFKDRRRWYRELRRTYRARNHFFRFKGAVNQVSLAKVIFMQTGHPVNNAYFQQLPLGSIRRKAEQEELLPAIQHYYRDILRMEGYPSEEPSALLRRGTHQYVLLPVYLLP